MSPSRQDSGVLLGIDVLRKTGYRALEGARVGLISNTSGRARDGELSRDLLFRAPNVNLVALFGPEHGFSARKEGPIQVTTDKVTGLPIYSLFGPNRKPTLETLKGVDTLVFDLQDVGVRYYTYMSTMLRVMEAAGEHDLRFVVLDRPNPIGGVKVEGPVLDEGLTTFVNYHPLPVRHGMTVGELARLLKDQRGLRVEIEVIPLVGWKRTQTWEETGLQWNRPSPNIRTPDQSFLYGAVGLLEGTNVSVGRGTPWPFEIVAAPWMQGARLMERLKSTNLPGVEFSPVRIVPKRSKYKGKPCFGLRVQVTDHGAIEPVRVGLAIAQAINELYPKRWKATEMVQLVGDRRVFQAVRQGVAVEDIVPLWTEALAEFVEERKKHLLYR